MAINNPISARLNQPLEIKDEQLLGENSAIRTTIKLRNQEKERYS